MDLGVGGQGGENCPPKKNIAPPPRKRRGAKHPVKKKKNSFSTKKKFGIFSNIYKKRILNFFSVLKSSETYAKKILPSALFEGGRGGGLQIVD